MTALPSATWRMLRQRAGTKRLPQNLDALWDAGAGFLARLRPRLRACMSKAAQAVAMEGEFSQKTDAVLREEAQDLRAVFRRERQGPGELLRAYALVREVARRQMGLHPFPVQLAGAFALESGCIAEMATGEGKTLVATMPATVGGWRGRGCHVITVNDYLAKRDAEWMAPVYRFCGLRVAYIEQGMKPPDRRDAYLADVTYCTNKEVAADFLRDRLALGSFRGLTPVLVAGIVSGSSRGAERLVQRGLEYAIIDEADSILIDEAVTPLIISGDAPNVEQVEAFSQAMNLVTDLVEGRDFRVNHRYREVDLTSEGKDRLEEIAEPLGGLWMGARRREELAVQALTARHLYHRDKQYILAEEKVVIVDEFTGRLMPDREWRDGLHQAVQAKEELPVQPPKDTYARISFQRFFRGYRKLCGMTGTAAEGWREFWQIYHLPVAVIPTNRPCARKLLPDRVFATQGAKWTAFADEIRRLHEGGRPVLVGTRSVRDSEHLSSMLSERGLEHQVLNAVRHAEEAQIVAQAGQEGAVTVATNMAGRGTDIVLGRGVAAKGGLHVLAGERNESSRVDRQLFGRCGRQGDPGTAQAFVSLEDELAVRHVPHLTAALRKRYGGAGGELPARAAWLFAHAQGKAQRMALSHRRGVLSTDDWLDDYLGFAGTEG
jgi:preprotein translocase subunit SecA